MISLGDADRRPVRLPLVMIAIIVVNTLMFLLELAGGDAFIKQWALVPAEVVAGRGWITILTAMFMHAITYPRDRIRTMLFESYRRRKEQGLDGAK